MHIKPYHVPREGCVARRLYAVAAAVAATAKAACQRFPCASFHTGDEILAGSIVDTNTPFLAKLLHNRGVDLKRVSFIPDDRAEIQRTLLCALDRVGPSGFVFTSGGIGPTHDDGASQRNQSYCRCSPRRLAATQKSWGLARYAHRHCAHATRDALPQ